MKIALPVVFSAVALACFINTAVGQRTSDIQVALCRSQSAPSLGPESDPGIAMANRGRLMQGFQQFQRAVVQEQQRVLAAKCRQQLGDVCLPTWALPDMPDPVSVETRGLLNRLNAEATALKSELQRVLSQRRRVLRNQPCSG